jgi:S-DNA-T family DNA segregation ATPase FtsK/SpoIIIE
MSVRADMVFDDRDDRMLFELGKAVFIAQREVSISLMQRHLRIGYRRALNIMVQLEQAGIVTKLNADNVRTLTLSEYMPASGVTQRPE